MKWKKRVGKFSNSIPICCAIQFMGVGYSYLEIHLYQVVLLQNHLMFSLLIAFAAVMYVFAMDYRHNVFFACILFCRVWFLLNETVSVEMIDKNGSSKIRTNWFCLPSAEWKWYLFTHGSEPANVVREVSSFKMNNIVLHISILFVLLRVYLYFNILVRN